MSRFSGQQLLSGLAIALVMLGISGCPNPEDTPTDTDTPTIYTAGYYNDESWDYFPCYWVGTARTDLPSGGNPGGEARAIIVE